MWLGSFLFGIERMWFIWSCHLSIKSLIDISHNYLISHTHSHITLTPPPTHTQEEEEVERDCLSRKLNTNCYNKESNTSMLVSLNTLLWAPRPTTATSDETSESNGSDSEPSSSTGQSGSTDDELNNGISELTVDGVKQNSLKDFPEIEQNLLFGETELYTDTFVGNTVVVGGSQEEVEESKDSSCDGDSELEDCALCDPCDFGDGVEPEFAFGDQLVDVTESSGDSGFYLSDDDDVSVLVKRVIA